MSTQALQHGAAGSARRHVVSDKHVKARRAGPRDAEVGRRVRTRRLEQRLSQTDLADRIGVTFQQVQKYEKGVNRIGAGRLERLSQALDVPIQYFFGGQTGAPGASKTTSEESIFGMAQTSGAVRLMKAFHAIGSRKFKQHLIGLAEERAEAEK